MSENDSEQNWEQVTVQVDQPAAERIRAVLTPILAGSLVVEKNYGDLFPQEVDHYRGPVRIYGYYPARERDHYRARVQNALARSGRPVQLEFSALPIQNWTTAWQERYQPIPVGEKLIVVPEWLENPHPDRLAVRISPGMAFGSGTHPTTQLSLALVEQCTEESQLERMIDIGCGSGILAIAGAKLGIQRVLGMDIDPDAVRISRENAAHNQVAGKVCFQQGSVREILSGETPFQQAPLVVANMIAPFLEELFQAGLGEIVSGNGKLILSGVLEEQIPSIRGWLDRIGFTLREQRQKAEWVGCVGEKGSAAS